MGWTSLTPESLTAPRECWPPKVLFLSGEETLPTCCVTSPPRLLTLPSRIPSRPCSPPQRMPPPPPSLPPTLPPVVPLELCLFSVYSLDYARTRLANDAKGKGGE